MKSSSQKQLDPAEQELSDLGLNHQQLIQNPFAPYVNMNQYQQNSYPQVAPEQRYSDLENNKENNNFLTFNVEKLKQNFLEESKACQMLTICNGIICILILGVIMKSL